MANQVGMSPLWTAEDAEKHRRASLSCSLLCKTIVHLAPRRQPYNMAEDAGTRRIPRAELFPSSPPPTTASSQPIQLEFEFAAPSVAHDDDVALASPSSLENEEVDFPLFSTATKAAAQRVRMRSATPERNEEDIWAEAVQTRVRPMEYWIIDDATLARRRTEFEQVVVTGEEVRAAAKVRWPGCELPWRVTHILARGPITSHCTATSVNGKHKRPGKRRRIAIRTAKEKEAAKEEARLKSLHGRQKWIGLTEDEKSRLDREERTRRNREKKAKRRIKEKAKKASAKAAEGVKGTEENSGDSDG